MKTIQNKIVPLCCQMAIALLTMYQLIFPQETGVTNGGFEITENDLPVEWVPSPAKKETVSPITIETGKAHSGKKSLRFMQADAASCSYVYITVKVTPRTDYTVTVWVQGENIESQPDSGFGGRVYIGRTKGNAFAQSPCLLGTFDWKQVNIDFNSAEATEIQVILFLNKATGTIRFDDFSIVPRMVLSAGKNVALGKRYTISKSPNYEPCADNDDNRQLTDGIFTAGKFWMEKSTVGWASIQRVDVIIDLGALEPISSIVVSTVGSKPTAGINFPSAIFYVSTDGRTFYKVGEQDGRKIPLKEEYYSAKLMCTNLKTKGRYAAVELSANGGYIFIDEILVGKGDQAITAAYQGAPIPKNTVTDALLGDYRDYISDLRKKMSQPPANLPAAALYLAEAMKHLDATEKKITELENNFFLDRAVKKEMSYLISFVGNIVLTNLQILSQPKTASPKVVSIYNVPVSLGIPVLPDTTIIPGEISGKLVITTSPGDCEPASIVVRANEDMQSVTVHCSELTGAGGILAGTNANVKIVKCWYQARGRDNNPVSRTSESIFVPELLLNDDALVKVDHNTTNNYLNINGNYELISERAILKPAEFDNAKHNPQVKDSSQILPVAISKGKNQQFLLRWQIPKNARAGEYRGKIEVLQNRIVMETLQVTINVTDFTPIKPFTSAIYYLGMLREGTPTYYKSIKSEQQYICEMTDLYNHGIDYPTISQGCETEQDEKLIGRIMEIRRQAGMDIKKVFYIGFTTQKAGTPEGNESILKKAAYLKSVFARFGCETLYIYGIDEASGEIIDKQIPVWESLNRIGVSVFVAGAAGNLKKAAKALNAFVSLGDNGPDLEEIGLFHTSGHEIFSYSNPQVGAEDPYIYRKNFGLLLAYYGMDGAMDYAYQRSFGSGWNDFDHEKYKDGNFVYLTADGVIGTLQFEGYREGIKDLKYFYTLKAALQSAEKSGKASSAVTNAKKFLDKIMLDIGAVANGNEFIDLDKIRAEMIRQIEELMRVER